MIKAVIFDLDDTLISENDFVKSGYRAVSSYISDKNNIDGLKTYKILEALFEKSTKNVFNRLCLSDEYKTLDVNELISLYRFHIPQITFYDDVIPTLEILKNDGVKTGIITDGNSITQKNKLKAVGAYDIFDKIITTGDYGADYKKPDYRVFEMMKNHFNIEYKEMIYVGDNPQKDFYIGKTMSVLTARIIRPMAVYENAPYLNDIKENYRIESLQDLFEITGNKSL